MAHIQKRETSMRRNGRPVVRWEVRWAEKVRDASGEEVRETGPDGATRVKLARRQKTFPTRADADAFLATVAHDKVTGRKIDYKGAETPFSVLAAAWLRSIRLEVKPRTAESYDLALRVSVLPHFGARPVGTISTADAREFMEGLRERGLAASSIRSAFGVFRRVLDRAAEDNFISTNPATRVKLPTARKLFEDFTPYVLSPEEVSAIAAELPAPFGLVVLFAAYTGLRQGEQAALDISDVTVTRAPGGHVGTVSVSKTTRKVKGGWETTSPKSKKSRRTVPLPGWLASDLAAYLDAHPRRDEPDAPLWPNRVIGGHTHGALTSDRRPGAPDYSRRWEPRSFVKGPFRAALLAARLTPAGAGATGGVRAHDLRHFFATTALAAEVPVMQVSEWLGHESYTVTMDVYAHWIPKEADRHIDRLSRPTAPAGKRDAAVVDLAARRASGSGA